MSVEVSVQYACDSPRNVTIPSDNEIRRWVGLALEKSTHRPNMNLQVTVRIVDKAEIRALNRDYRAKDMPTNVLSFPFEVPPGLPIEAMDGELGDVVVCAQVVVEEAQQQDKPLVAHWAHMIIHGTLHLLGYDHESEAEAADMESLEIALLRKLGYADPYQDSVCA